ncbi:uncharacterized protein BYT42DRAFT_490361 [Radiomyces spectabilis]|uniref:uncharacterized protein n=1 Tax=Radiomyces spectabilis TaxID=64574 RepID=UPI00221E8924|nr:uncharacterized protein BYT42DRAFT_490361 [Radiomyces spectabilis]KAI8391456.1 hypothetical protein BYT42DRAFT_490361 [Radiomyces spectabilis]
MSTSFVVISGGSACNYVARAFHENSKNNVCYVLGIADNGGSTSEILRVLGGPSIGDLRSRLTKLMDIMDDTQTPERRAIKELLSHRLPANAPEQAVKDEWASIVEGRHRLWDSISVEKKEAIRGFLTSFNFEILKRAHKRFKFCNGSIGNFFLTGARLFFGSLEAALFLFSAITGISEPTTVVPVINTNHTATIAALLENGDTLVGQCEISHPSPSSRISKNCAARKRTNPIDAFTHLTEDDDEAFFEESNNLCFSKEAGEKLVSRIQRIHYINEYAQEIYPIPNPKVISHLSQKQTLVYSIGSLYTSIVPCLVLRNVGNTIAHSTSLQHKIFLLNGSNDRETTDYTALDFIQTVTLALNESQRIDARRAFYQSSMAGSPTLHYPPFPDNLFFPSPPSSFITHLIYLHNSAVSVDLQRIEKLGIQCIKIQGIWSDDGLPVYSESALTKAIQSIVCK